MNWQFHPALSSFAAVKNDWDYLNRSRSNHILLDAGFVEPLLQCFGTNKVLLGTGGDPASLGMALFVQKKTGVWETFQPSQAPLGMIVLGPSATAQESVRAIAGALPGYALQLSFLQQDPDFPSVPLSQDSPDCACERTEYIQTARITLEGTFEEYWKRRGGNLRHNLARRRRRMTEKGFVAQLVEIRDPAAVAGAICSYGDLESRGWKGKDGTAVSKDNVQGRFYRHVFEHFAALGEAVIFQLHLNGKVAASDLCLLRGGMMVVLKTAYDEEMNDFSPALLMREEILKRAFESQSVRTVEFYGRVMEWHTKWSEEVRTLYHFNCFRHSWVPGLRKLVGRFA